MITKSKKTKGYIGLKNDRLFYCLILAFPVLQFVIFYLGVNFNSFLLAFKDITMDESMHYHTEFGFKAFRDAFALVKTPEILQIVKVSFLSYFVKTVISLPLLLASVLGTLDHHGLNVPGVELLPLSELGLGWITPAIVFGLIAYIFSKFKPKPQRKTDNDYA